MEIDAVVLCADPERCAVGLEIGDPAPFNGQLLSPLLAAELQVAADGCDDRIDMEVDIATKTSSVVCFYKTESQKLEIALLRDTNERIRASQHWYEEPIIVAPVTAVLTVVLTLLVAKSMQWVQ